MMIMMIIKVKVMIFKNFNKNWLELKVSRIKEVKVQAILKECFLKKSLFNKNK